MESKSKNILNIKKGFFARKKFEICQTKFDEYRTKILKDPSSDKVEYIRSGRDLCKLMLNLYLKTSTKILLERFLIISRLIEDSYDQVNRPEYEAYFVKDKCKLFALDILVNLMLNNIENVEDRFKEFYKHIDDCGLNRSTGEIIMFKSVRMLYRMYNVISVRREGIPQKIDNRIGEFKYENQPFNGSTNFKIGQGVIYATRSCMRIVRNLMIDSLRMFQAVEYNQKTEGANGDISNFPKRLLYDEGIWSVSCSIISRIGLLKQNELFFLYINGDSYNRQSNNAEDYHELFVEGIKMKQSSDITVSHDEQECLYLGDIEEFLMVPTILIIESQNSHSFSCLTKRLNVNVLFLLSPIVYPKIFSIDRYGSLYTLFLSSPQTAFTYICCGQTVVDYPFWSDMITQLDKFMELSIKKLESLCKKNKRLLFFMEDTTCRILFVRHLFCLCCLRLHVDFLDKAYYPQSNFQSIESAIIFSLRLHGIVYQMASLFNAGNRFSQPSNLTVFDEILDV